MNNLEEKGQHFALIGKRLSHSFSQRYFERKYQVLGLSGYSYSLLEMPTLDNLRTVVAEKELSGFNVTNPYKMEIIPLLDDIDPIAAEIGAVNTVKATTRRSTDGSDRLHLTGYNTDAPAFMETLRSLLLPHHRHALILGTGGASHAVAWALDQLEIRYLFVSRNPSGRPNTIGYSEAYDLAGSHTLIVNATPAGTFPDNDTTPWQHPELLSCQHLCYDLVYNPSPTRFMKEAATHDASICDGLSMLHRQADLAFEIFSRKIV